MKIARIACLTVLSFTLISHADEGRIEVAQGDLPLTIASPGSYILTGNLGGAGLGDAITITSSQVTLDLNGFEMDGSSGTGDAIAFGPSVKHINVRNGIIRNWGRSGIDGDSGTRCVYEDLTLSDNAIHGLNAGSMSHIMNVTSTDNNGDGVRALYGSLVQNSIATDNGIGTTGSGFVITESCILLECIASKNGGSEIVAQRRNRIERNLCNCNGGPGPNTGKGIEVTADDNLVRDNHVTGCATAYSVTGFGVQDNIVIANTSADNNTGFNISGSNTAGEETTDIASTNNVNAGHGFMNIRQ